MRPSQIAAYRHTERHTQVRQGRDGRSFALSVPFAPLHPLSLMVRGSAKAKLMTPGGKTLAPVERLPGEACAMFDVMPENGTYRVLAVER
jgi:hypothetical protein